MVLHALEMKDWEYHVLFKLCWKNLTQREFLRFITSKMLYSAEEIFAVEGFLINFAELFFAIQENEPIFAELTFAIERF